MSRSSPQHPLPVALAGLIAMAAALGISRFVYTPILPVMADAIHLSKSDTGLIASANLLGYLIGALLAATPRLPGSRRSWLLGSLGVSAVTTGMMGLTTSMAGFVALRLIGGAASAFVLVVSSTLVLETLALMGRSGLSSLHFAGVGAGIALSAMLVSSLSALGADWRALWLAAGILALAAVVAVACLVPSREPVQTGRAPQAARARPRGLAALITAYGLFGFGYIVTATFLVAIVRGLASAWHCRAAGLAGRRPDRHAPSVALWTSAASRFGSATPVQHRLRHRGDWSGRERPLAIGHRRILFASALLGGTFMGLTAMGLAAARQLAPMNPRPVLARMTASFGLGQILGPRWRDLVRCYRRISAPLAAGRHRPGRRGRHCPPSITVRFDSRPAPALFVA